MAFSGKVGTKQAVRMLTFVLNNLLNFVSRCYLEFYFCFTKTEIKFMSLRAKSRGLTERASIPQMLLRNLIQEMV